MDIVKIMICSDIDYDRLIAEIYIDDKFIALLNQEKGPDKMEIEFPGSAPDEYLICRKVCLQTFLKAVHEAGTKLLGE